MGKTLLLADDSVTIQKVVGITFANEDIELVTESDGDAALECAKRIGPDIVLADVSMPGLNGYELCAAIKAEPSLARVPVILLTGTFETYDEERTGEVGADGHIAKPFEAQALVDLVHQTLQRASQAAAPAPPEPAASDAAAQAAPAPPPLAEPHLDSVHGQELLAARPQTDPLPPVLATRSEHGEVIAPPPTEASYAHASPPPPTEPGFPAPGADPASTPVPTEPDPVPPTPPAHELPETVLDDAIESDELEVVPAPGADAAPATDPDKTHFFDPRAPLRELAQADPPVAPSQAEPLPDPAPVAPAAPVAPVELAPEPAAAAFVVEPVAPTGQPEPVSLSQTSDPGFAATGDQSDIFGEPLVAEPIDDDEDDAIPVPPPPNEAALAAEEALEAVEALPEDTVGPRPEPPELHWAEPLDSGTDHASPSLRAEPVSVLEQPGEATLADTSPSDTPAPTLDPQQVRDALEKVAWDAFGSLSEQVVGEVLKKVEEITWEIVPKLAERLIQEEIDRLRAEPEE